MKEKKDLNIQIGLRLKKAREAAGLTQDKFAELIERLKRLPARQLDVALDINDKIFEAFALQENCNR